MAPNEDTAAHDTVNDSSESKLPATRQPVATTAADQAVQKANEAIAIRPKRGRMTLLSRRIYNVFLFHAQQQGVDRPSYSILLSELIDDARFTSNNTELLKSHIRDMQATTIEWHTSSGTAQRWTSTQLLGPVTIDEPGRGRPCTITWSYPEPIRERLVRPSQYTRILLEISSQMRSYAAAVLYELGSRYLTSPSRLTMREDIIWWASVLTGRSDITAVDYRILHRDTIKKALIELDMLTEGFRLELVEHRRGRKVEELQFRVIPKQQAALEGLKESAKNVFDLALVERVIALGLKRVDAQDLYAVTDEGVLRSAVEHVEARLKSQTLPPLKSPGAYLRDALKKRYPEATPRLDETQTAALAHAPSKPKPMAIEDKMTRLREDWQHHRTTQARARFQEEMPQQVQDDYLVRFEHEYLANAATPIARAWRKDGINSRVVSASFYRWLATVLWPEPVSDKELLEFAMSRGT